MTRDDAPTDPTTPAPERRSAHRRFLAAIGLTFGGVLAAVLALNLAVDPLWYVGGNRLTGENYAFDERAAKANLLLADAERYDCLILGSSTATLMPADAVPGRTCFNFAFSRASLREMVEVLTWVRARGLAPDLILVGLDDYQFYGLQPMALPRFYRTGERPPGVLAQYLSWGTAEMSLKTVAGDSPLPRYYDAGFDVRVLDGVAGYAPPADADGASARRVEFLEGMLGATDTTTPALPATTLGDLATVFPESRVIAFTPPMASWYRAAMRRDGVWAPYVDALIDAATVVDRVCDYSSIALAEEDTHTYDGIHFDAATNADLARGLGMGEGCGHGVAVLPSARATLLGPSDTATVAQPG